MAVATLGKRKQVPRGALTEDQVRRVMAAAGELAEAMQVEPAAPVALRLAAVTGGRRSELAALRWEDLDGDRLAIDSSVAIIRHGTPEDRKRPAGRLDEDGEPQDRHPGRHHGRSAGPVAASAAAPRSVDPQRG